MMGRPPWPVCRETIVQSTEPTLRSLFEIRGLRVTPIRNILRQTHDDPRLGVDDVERRCLFGELRLSLRHGHLFKTKGIMDGRETWSRRRLTPASTYLGSYYSGRPASMRGCIEADQRTLQVDHSVHFSFVQKPEARACH
ncbi:hypothetical protein J3459_006544 [Metarhizium acridum]|uniref:uncharacterized protein n=1 Tax=Metarhizium acridum TaxID=92637 RepID=UPI001C6BCD9D|nr:hypothetical protein J3458_005065 [Metarhizium acridum]KAG8427581.1 hypothetical protein J3459_006544 [Metarhizium acridum]